MERVLLTWNIPNWITVVLMVALGYLLVSLAAQLVKGRLGSTGAAAGGVAGNVVNMADFMGIGA